jgi:hypothetical protein
MGSFDDEFFPKRAFEIQIPGLVRMDRALLYLRHRLRTLVADIEKRTTKSIGEYVYRVFQFVREAQSLCRMSGEQELYSLVRTLTRGINQRTSRREYISTLKEFSVALDGYQPTANILNFDELPEKARAIGQELNESDEVAEAQVSDEKSVFVIMPFASEFADVWKGGIQRAAADEGLTPIRVDMISRSTNITDDIVSSIDRCHMLSLM